MITRIPLTDAAISTSGDYERFFEEDGVRYHHIIDPHTGHSASKVRSATIIGPNATRTDGLSKTAFVLGPEKAMDNLQPHRGHRCHHRQARRHGDLFQGDRTGAWRGAAEVAGRPSPRRGRPPASVAEIIELKRHSDVRLAQEGDGFLQIVALLAGLTLTCRPESAPCTLSFESLSSLETFLPASGVDAVLQYRQLPGPGEIDFGGP